MSVKYLGGAGTYYIATDPDLSPYYQHLTVDNFFYKISSVGSTQVYGNHFERNRAYMSYSAPSLSYDSSTGVLTVSNGACGGYARATNTGDNTYFSNLTTPVSVYCIFAD